MTGIELSKEYFETYGKPMLEQNFADLLPYLAVGFVGKGSDRFGFDDEISKDHDFEPGFCIFLPDEELIDRKQSFALERAYSKLPKEFMGYKRQNLSPVGGNRNGIIRTSDFYLSTVFSPDGNLDINTWLNIPQFLLAEAVNGEIFFDNLGEFTAVRNVLKNMPLDIKIKRISKKLLEMGQAGQYNYDRCLKHGENEAAQLACYDFVTCAIEAIFLLKGEYMPYYKWSFKALRKLDNCQKIAEDLAFLISYDNSQINAKDKQNIIESISAEIVKMLIIQGLTTNDSSELEKQAYLINDVIKDGYIRNYSI